MREFRAFHETYASEGIAIAGVSFDPVERARVWVERLDLPYPLLSDHDRAAALAFGLVRRIGFGGWSIEFMRRATVLADRHATIRAVWENVKVRGHAQAVLDAARLLPAIEEERPGRLQPP